MGANTWVFHIMGVVWSAASYAQCPVLAMKPGDGVRYALDGEQEKAAILPRGDQTEFLSESTREERSCLSLLPCA